MLKNMDNQEFLRKLEAEAAQQARLYQSRILPPQLDWLSSLIGRYPWQVMLVASGLTAAAISWWGVAPS
jgi:hypothetical protein